MNGQILDGTSMDDYPLTLTSIIERTERFHADREVVSRRPSGRPPGPRSEPAPVAPGALPAR
jgi:hypothetical protein